MRARRSAGSWLFLLGCWLLAGCQSTGTELGGLAATPPLDFAVLLTGGAFVAADPAGDGTFGAAQAGSAPDDGTGGTAAAAPFEAIGIDAVAAVLGQGRVFRRIDVDPDPQHRRAIGRDLPGGADRDAVLGFLHGARERGFDLLLVVEELRDGPIDAQGVNARWPVTFATWILLGVGALIPDHTFESRATLRVTLRDLHSGRVLNESLLVGGPIDLSLTERTDWLGLVSSILVPPFWVGDDREAVRGSVQAVTRRRMLVSLAHDLKSESVRQRLLRGGAATLQLTGDGGDARLVVDARESLSAVRLRSEPPLPADVERDFAAELLRSLQPQGQSFHYEAPLPPVLRGRQVQVLVATIRGGVASATFMPGGGQ